MIYYETEDYKQCKQQLMDEYALYFDKIETYIQTTGFSMSYNIEEDCLYQIIDDLLSAQKDERPVASITGTDLKKYCHTMVAAEISRSKENANDRLKIALYLLTTLLLMFIKMLFLDIKEDNDLPLMTRMQDIRLGIFEGGLWLLGFVLTYMNKVIARVYLDRAKVSRHIHKLVNTIFTMIMIQFIMYATPRKYFNLGIPIPLPLYLTLSILLLLYIIIATIQERKKRRQFNNWIEVDQMEQKVCPACGKQHDIDYPRCPYCKYKYSNNDQEEINLYHQ